MLAQHSSETNEAYTPGIIIDPARATMGSIDLDPASCALAQTVVQAGVWYGIADDGLRQPWAGSVFLNPPGGKLHKDTLQPFTPGGKGNSATNCFSSAAVWWCRLVQSYLAGEVRQAIFVCFTMAVFRSVQAPEMVAKFGKVPPPYVFPFLVPAERINYDKVVWHHTDNDPTKGVWKRVPTKGAPSDTAIVYLPDRSNLAASLLRFHGAFGHLGCWNDHSDLHHRHLGSRGSGSLDDQ